MGGGGGRVRGEGTGRMWTPIFWKKNASHFQVINVREKNIPQSMKFDYTIPSSY